ncbi:MAG TPA: hypothetical protein VFS24_21010, partial [Steroidobacteraceae bacterium]|nr:hypothetical protein [Steroidobacteraceae bacterium]
LARMAIVCSPSVRPVRVTGSVTALNVALSRLASKELPPTEELASKVAERSLDSAEGFAVIVVSGEVVLDPGELGESGEPGEPGVPGDVGVFDPEPPLPVDFESPPPPHPAAVRTIAMLANVLQINRARWPFIFSPCDADVSLIPGITRARWRGLATHVTWSLKTYTRLRIRWISQTIKP